jgi:predicted nucleic acid-binding protein
MEIVCLDTSILIDHYRKKDKTQTRFAQLARQYDAFAVSALVEYEFLRGEKDTHNSFWQALFNMINVLPFDRVCAQKAASIYISLTKQQQNQRVLDILIASTALAWDYPLATLNTRDFEGIAGLRLV